MTDTSTDTRPPSPTTASSNVPSARDGSPPFATATRRPLFDASAYELDGHQEYDVAPDGRFLMVRDRGVTGGAKRELVWVQNWVEELRAKMER